MCLVFFLLSKLQRKNDSTIILDLVVIKCPSFLCSHFYYFRTFYLTNLGKCSLEKHFLTVNVYGINFRGAYFFAFLAENRVVCVCVCLCRLFLMCCMSRMTFL